MTTPWQQHSDTKTTTKNTLEYDNTLATYGNALATAPKPLATTKQDTSNHSEHFSNTPTTSTKKTFEAT